VRVSHPPEKTRWLERVAADGLQLREAPGVLRADREVEDTRRD